jgi:hypothetical protein
MAPPERSAEALIAAWRSLPRVDLTELRRDLDELIDPGLSLSTADARDVAGSRASRCARCGWCARAPTERRFL